MARALGIDYGAIRTGLAVTDPLKISVNPLPAIHTKFLMEYIVTYLKAESVDLIVLGDPYHRDGLPTELNLKIHSFGNELVQKYPAIRIEYQDERNTSQQAVKLLIKKGTPKSKRDKQAIDTMSAVLILQKYLNHY